MRLGPQRGDKGSILTAADANAIVTFAEINWQSFQDTGCLVLTPMFRNGYCRKTPGNSCGWYDYQLIDGYFLLS